VTLKPLPNTSSAAEQDFLGPLEKAYRQVGEAINPLIDKFDAGVRHVYDTMGPVVFIVKKHLDALVAGIKQLAALVKYAVEHHVPVVSLVVQSFRWLTEVQSPISDLSAPVMEARNPDLEYWSGTGASVYWKKMSAQQGAINAVTAKAAYISEWLMKIATANVTFMTELAGTVIDILSKFVTISLDTLSIVAIPEAVGVLAKEVGNILAEGVKRMVGTADTFMKALSDARDIVSEVGDHTKLSGGKWPQAVYEPNEPFGGHIQGTRGLGLR
jgi:phage-related protein